VRPEGEEERGCLDAILIDGGIVTIGDELIELSQGLGRGGMIPR
jgi:hypothetical protein